jgi:hypothetical protein
MADGIAYVMITHPGLWMVRVEHQIAEAKPTHERDVARAVLCSRRKNEPDRERCRQRLAGAASACRLPTVSQSCVPTISGQKCIQHPGGSSPMTRC